MSLASSDTPMRGLTPQEVAQSFISLEQNPGLRVLVQAVTPRLGGVHHPMGLSFRSRIRVKGDVCQSLVD